VCRKKVRKKKLQLFFSTNKKNVTTKKKCVKKIVCVLSACKQAEILHEKHLSYYKKERIKITKLSFRREK